MLTLLCLQCRCKPALPHPVVAEIGDLDVGLEWRLTFDR